MPDYSRTGRFASLWSLAEAAREGKCASTTVTIKDGEHLITLLTEATQYSEAHEDSQRLRSEAEARAATLQDRLPPDRFTIEVRRQSAGDDPSVYIYHATITATPVRQMWTDTLPTVERLETYLLAWKAALTMAGYMASTLGWGIPEQWQEPSGKRWTMSRDSLDSCEEFNSEGAVIRV